jgi:hypothetical protein
MRKSQAEIESGTQNGPEFRGFQGRCADTIADLPLRKLHATGLLYPIEV